MADNFNVSAKIDTTDWDAFILKLKAAGVAFKDTQTTATTATTAIQKGLKDTKDASDDTATTINKGLLREFVVLGHEVTSGNFSRIPGSMLVLAERSQTALDILKLFVSPLGLLVAGAGALGLAMYEASVSTSALNSALTTTNNISGLTNAKFVDLSETLSKQVGTTVRSTSQLLAGLAGSGRIGADAFDSVAKSAALFAEISGEKVPKVVSMFAELGKDPVRGAEKLNETLHFLTLAQYEAIEAEQKAGNTQQALVLASDALSASMEKNKPTLSFWEEKWTNLKRLFVDAGDGMRHFFSAGLDSTEQLAQLNEKITAVQEQIAKTGPNTATGGGRGQTANLGQVLAGLLQQRQVLLSQAASAERKVQEQAHQQELQDQGIQAKDDLDLLRKTIETRAQLRADEIARAKADFAALSLAGSPVSGKDQAAIIAGINEKYKDKVDNTFDNALVKGRQLLEDANQQLDTGTKITEGQKLLNELYDTSSTLYKHTNDEQRTQLAGLFTAADLQERAIQDQKELLRLQQEQNRELEKQASAWDSLKTKLKSATAETAAAQEAFDQLTGTGKKQTPQEKKLSEQQVLLRQRQENYNNVLQSTAGDNSGTAQEQVEIARQQLLTQQQITDEYQKQVDIQKQLVAAQNDGLNGYVLGWKEAFQKYTESAKSNAALGAQAFNDTANIMSKSLATFVTTGKFNFADFTSAILADLAKIAAEKAIAGIAGSLFGSLFGGATGGTAGATVDAGTTVSTVTAIAAGGFDVPSNSNPVTQLHAQEMVLPANLANVVRAAATSGSSGGSNNSPTFIANITINGSDSSNPSDNLKLSAQLRQQLQAFWNEMNDKANRAGGVNNRTSMQL